MNSSSSNPVFSGSVPQFYQRYVVPVIFEPYAADLVGRAVLLAPTSVLEIAAGTGVLTRHLADRLPSTTSIVATDLNPAMLEQAQHVGTSRAVTWRQADAMQLPFAADSFDAVMCQFGYMFPSDRVAAYAEARRVLRPGGTLLFNVWGRMEDNDFANIVTESLAQLFPTDPPRFLARIPHGYHDRAAISSDLVLAGFGGVNTVDTVTLPSRADSARDAAIGFCQGTPLRAEIEARGENLLERATDIATAALAQRFGAGPVTANMQAHVVGAPKVD
ncbi:class I SAM-dependent methyltransferase [Diaphorobacter sp. HDW4A]|uniref:class I SAM-dependent methyltransferase n=1 Tax=Diaphorobacter sp. HDW4A TaxID=2714924 RepID=UPI00140C6CAA|nr:class I SAM-dependent methyltransferase [Diaphorobacter sp. HDW4A]QIL82845.1 class I SAM-dependent methyltransferase [Diaphorobacter sp. HDW4A]